jgi:hypothetical protein
MRPVPGNGAIALFCLAIGLVTFAVRIRARVLVFYEPCHLEFAHFPQYIALFAAGAMAHRHRWFDALSDRQARTWGEQFLVVRHEPQQVALARSAQADDGNALTCFYSAQYRPDFLRAIIWRIFIPGADTGSITHTVQVA